MTCSANSTIWTVDFDKILPTVFVVPSPHAKHFSKTDCRKFVDIRDHSQDILFYCFIVYHYPRAIKTIKSNEVVDLFFYHVSGSSEYPPVWNNYDHSLHDFTVTNPLAKKADFNLDKTFCVYTHPLMPTAMHHIGGLRYVKDIHHFRSDYILTPNGRDVFIPYVEVPPATSGKIMSNHELFLHRKYVIMHASSGKSDGKSEAYRLYSTQLHSHLKSLFLEKALISNNLKSPEFDEGLENSLFCLILPGDTPSTAKVYKAIFRGCIPVIFVSFPAQLPFYQFIDWSSFSLIFYKDDINHPRKIDGIVQTIYNMSRNVAELKRMHVSLAKHAVLFDYSRWEWPSVYHLSLLSLQAMISDGKDLLLSSLSRHQNRLFY
eukprot:scaffold2007_cov161-Ochromonas_danica.AAC.4